MSAPAEHVSAAAKVNLALLVGPRREDGLHEVVTVMQRIGLCDRLEFEPGRRLEVAGFAEDTLVRRALRALAVEARVEPLWRVRIDKQIPVAAGLGGGSADAAAALTLANRLLPRPLPRDRLVSLAARLGADVPFFLDPGPKLAEGAGERLTPLRLPQGYTVVIVLEEGRVKSSTGHVYSRFDELGGGPGFEERRAALLTSLAGCRRPRDLAALPPNDLAEAAGSSALPARLRGLGAFRADVCGAGPSVYALFERRRDAAAAAAALGQHARTWVVDPAW